MWGGGDKEGSCVSTSMSVQTMNIENSNCMNRTVGYMAMHSNKTNVDTDALTHIMLDDRISPETLTSVHSANVTAKRADYRSISEVQLLIATPLNCCI